MAVPLGESGGRGIGSSRFYTPILPYLLAALAAFFAAGCFGWLRAFADSFLSWGLAFVLAEATLRFAVPFLFPESRSLPVFRSMCFCARMAGTFLIFVWYFYLRVEANPYENFAPREMSIVARIDEVSRGVNDSRYGIATIISAPECAKNAKGCKMWFTVSDGKRATAPNKNFVVSQTVRFKGVLSATFPDEPKSRGFYANKPESRAFEKYLRSRFIFFKMICRVADAEIIGEAEGRFNFYEGVRSYMERSLSTFLLDGLDGSEAALTYRAMILGDKSLLTREQKKGFADTGTMHVFAISGLHVGFAAAILYGALSLFGVNWRLQPVFALPALYLYVCACGSRPSALRAFGMIAVVWVALAFSRGMRPFGALVFAAFVSVLYSPDIVFDAGFGLSYSIVAAIFVYSIPLYRYAALKTFPKVHVAETSAFGRFCKWARTYFVGAFCISVGAMFAAAPLSAHYFSYVAPMSAVYSPFFVGGAGIAVGLGVAGFALPSFISSALNTVAALVVGAMSSAAKFAAETWSGRIDFPLPSFLAAYCAVFCFLAISVCFERSKSAFLRFVLAPVSGLSIMLLSLFKNG